MRGLISHLRYTVRLLLKSPGFTITTVLILGLGIGANTAIFSLVNCVLLKPLPYPNPDRLVSIYQVIQGEEKSQFDYPDYLDVRANRGTLDSQRHKEHKARSDGKSSSNGILTLCPLCLCGETS